ncbi:MAG: ABC transporter ATP-binding protein [Pirellulaceae bacterium]|nr:ABC transporter ATP-binding protein [Pirellulaceae bacterium]
MAVVELTEVDATLSGSTVLRGINLKLERGQRLAVLGVSGAGKSTLLRVMTGLLVPACGQVHLRGQPMQSIPTAKRNIAWVSQDYALYPQLDVRHNLRIALQHANVPRHEIDARIDQAAEQFDIGSLMRRLPSQISGGQAQRVALAKALIRRPDVLLLDEPLSQLDGGLREQLIDRLLALSEEYQMSWCWVTHNAQEAMRVATHLAVLDQGRVLQLDRSQQVYDHPRSLRVAELLSPWGINQLPADVPEFAAITRLASRTGLAAAIRPEHCLIGCCALNFQAPPSATARALAKQLNPSHQASSPDVLLPITLVVQVQQVQSVGFAQLIFGRIGSQRLMALAASGTIATGQTVTISVWPQRILWFDV